MTNQEIKEKYNEVGKSLEEAINEFYGTWYFGI